MSDPRVDNLARILVGYSTKVERGRDLPDRGLDGGRAAGRRGLRGGPATPAANPVVALSFDGQSATYYREASDAQLEWISPLSEWAAEEADCRIAIGADTNTRELSGVAPERQTRRQAATRRADGEDDGARRRGRAPLGLHAVSRPTPTPPTPR